MSLARARGPACATGRSTVPASAGQLGALGHLPVFAVHQASLLGLQAAGQGMQPLAQQRARLGLSVARRVCSQASTS